MNVKRNKGQFADFASNASPHSWLIVAENLHLQAFHLHQDHRGQVILTEISDDGHSASWDATNRAVFLLGGFALENAIKALLVHEFPEWVSNGRLGRQLRTHSLTILERMSGYFPNRREHRWVLAEFEDGLESWARYPCSLDADREAEEMLMDEELWEGYLKVMKSLGRRISWLLQQGWQGPHGVFEQWRAEGDLWLGSTKGRKSLSRPSAIDREIVGTSR